MRIFLTFMSLFSAFSSLGERSLTEAQSATGCGDGTGVEHSFPEPYTEVARLRSREIAFPR